MIEDTISTETAQRFYDRLGARHDWARLYEGRARAVALDLLGVVPGQRVLEIGAGTGADLATLRDRAGPTGSAVGIDISPVMLGVAGRRSGARLCHADARDLPFAGESFDHVFSAYVLDLIAARDLPTVLAEVSRVLVPGGRVALVSLTQGATLPSRLLVGAWTALYRLSPAACGGCRPIPLATLVRDAGLVVEESRVVVQLAVPSAVVVASRPGERRGDDR